jgi:methionyl aminopeptidase
MITVKNSNEIEKMRQVNGIVGRLLHNLGEMVRPGITTAELNAYAEEFIRSNNGFAAFKGYTVPGLPPFPAATCISVNSCIVHGIPSTNVVLQDGDIVGVDVGVRKDGFYGDAARTYVVGTISAETQRLLDVTQEALARGMDAARDGNRVGDISHAIGSFVEQQGFFVADNLTGHGIGRELHEEPMIPNTGRAGRGPRLKAGMTVAIEPMVNVGTHRSIEKGWEWYVADNSLSAHFENTILITNGKPEILTK